MQWCFLQGTTLCAHLTPNSLQMDPGFGKVARVFQMVLYLEEEHCDECDEEDERADSHGIRRVAVEGEVEASRVPGVGLTRADSSVFQGVRVVVLRTSTVRPSVHSSSSRVADGSAIEGGRDLGAKSAYVPVAVIVLVFAAVIVKVVKCDRIGADLYIKQDKWLSQGDAGLKCPLSCLGRQRNAPSACALIDCEF